jgi:hypothetical protein
VVCWSSFLYQEVGFVDIVDQNETVMLSKGYVTTLALYSSVAMSFIIIMLIASFLPRCELSPSIIVASASSNLEG